MSHLLPTVEYSHISHVALRDIMFLNRKTFRSYYIIINKGQDV